MRPKIVYVDDERESLRLFKATLPNEWDIHVFDNPLSALGKLEEINPCLIAADQRMPKMTGIKFLEIARNIAPQAKRVLITGFSDEELVIESVRTAQVGDYIRKPWDADDLEIRLQKVIESYVLERALGQKQKQLAVQNRELQNKTKQLEAVKFNEERIRKELESWVPAFVLQAVESAAQFPMRRNLALITFDIIKSAALHDTFIEGKPARTHLLRAFSELIIRHGGWRESQAGDSAYAHFGLLRQSRKPAEAAYAVATEFRVFLRNFCQQHDINIECGIGLHYARDCLIEVHEIQCTVLDRVTSQKSVDSTSTDVDLVHRMEAFTHQLPGSNIILSRAFVEQLSTPPSDLVALGVKNFKGQKIPTQVFLKKSDLVTENDLAILKGPATLEKL